MPKPQRHRTQREKAAIHFLTNISLDGAKEGKKAKPYVADEAHPCDCAQCAACLVPNENFIRPVMAPLFLMTNASPSPTVEEGVEAELMDLWSLGSSTVKNSPVPRQENPESGSHSW